MLVFCFVSPHTCLFPGRANGQESGSRESCCPPHLGFAEGNLLEMWKCWGRLVQTPALMPSSWSCSSLAWRRTAVEVMDRWMGSCSSPGGQVPTGSKAWRISFPLLREGNHPENNLGNGISIPAGRIMLVLRTGQLGPRSWLLSHCPVSWSNPELSLRSLCVRVLVSRGLCAWAGGVAPCLWGPGCIWKLISGPWSPGSVSTCSRNEYVRSRNPDLRPYK